MANGRATRAGARATLTSGVPARTSIAPVAHIGNRSAMWAFT
jgi:hypothetical protein